MGAWAQEEIHKHSRNVLAITHSRELDCLITGGEDATIQLHYLSGVVPTFNDVPLPTSFTVRELDGRLWGQQGGCL